MGFVAGSTAGLLIAFCLAGLKGHCPQDRHRHPPEKRRADRQPFQPALTLPSSPVSSPPSRATARSAGLGSCCRMMTSRRSRPWQCMARIPRLSSAFDSDCELFRRGTYFRRRNWPRREILYHHEQGNSREHANSVVNARHLRMSALGGKADVRELPSGCPLIAKSGHSSIQLPASVQFP